MKPIKRLAAACLAVLLAALCAAAAACLTVLARFLFIFSFYGLIDLLTILPFYFLDGFIVFRMLRVVRIFHLFRINTQYDSFNVIKAVIYEKRNQQSKRIEK